MTAYDAARLAVAAFALSLVALVTDQLSAWAHLFAVGIALGVEAECLLIEGRA